jgi:predicted CXXCH cytochrome family protein
MNRRTMVIAQERRRTLALLVCVAACLALGVRNSWSGLKGTAHDFSTARWNTSGEVCLPCHISHVPPALSSEQMRLGLASGKRALPLWNRQTTTATFQLYRSDTLDAVTQQPSASSKLCLSCHDGTVALNSFGGRRGDEFLPSGAANLGIDLSNDHPISIRYDSALARRDKGLYDPSVRTVPALKGKSIREAMLIDDQVECSSCHDVHAARGQSRTAGKLVLVDNSGSGLCLTCHDK